MANYSPRVEAATFQGLDALAERLAAENIPHSIDDTGGLTMRIHIKLAGTARLAADRGDDWTGDQHEPDGWDVMRYAGEELGSDFRGPRVRPGHERDDRDHPPGTRASLTRRLSALLRPRCGGASSRLRLATSAAQTSPDEPQPQRGSPTSKSQQAHPQGPGVRLLAVQRVTGPRRSR